VNRNSTVLGALALLSGITASSNVFAQSTGGPSIAMPDLVADVSDVPPSQISTYTQPTVGSGRRSTIGGYGEGDLILQDEAGTSKSELRRFVLFLGHDFTDKLSFYSELEIEHGGAETGVEQAYMEARIHRKIGIRAGLLLMPVGIINVLHEPPTFFTVLRPISDRLIIPSTWRDMGAGIFGELTTGLHYNLYAITGFDASKFSESKNIRDGRGKGLSAKSEDIGTVGRLHYNGILGLDAGASVYFGQADQGNPALSGVRVTLAEADARYTRNGFEIRGQFAQTWVRNSWKVNKLLAAQSPAASPMGSQARGGYVHAGYDVLRLIVPGSNQQLWTFTGYENVNTVAEVSNTPGAKAADAKQYGHLGLSYKPHWQVAFKLDWQMGLNDAADPNLLALGVGLMF
jgi:hypothetical protein